MCDRAGNYKEFSMDNNEFQSYSDKWTETLDRYYAL